MTATKNRGCAGKVRYASQSAAAETLAKLVAKGAAEEWLNVYRCRKHCGGWHVGHRPGRRRQ